MPDSAVVARGRKKAVQRGTAGTKRRVRQPLSDTPTPSKAKRNAKSPLTGKSASEPTKLSGRAKPISKEILNAKPAHAEAAEVAAFAQSLPESYLYCRELGHNWKAWTARQVDDSIERVLRCNRCRCERHQILTLTGGVHSNKYVHPEGYLHDGMGRIVGDGRDALRMESIKRTIRETDKRKKVA